MLSLNPRRGASARLQSSPILHPDFPAARVFLSRAPSYNDFPPAQDSKVIPEAAKAIKAAHDRGRRGTRTNQAVANLRRPTRRYAKLCSKGSARYTQQQWLISGFCFRSWYATALISDPDSVFLHLYSVSHFPDTESVIGIAINFRKDEQPSSVRRERPTRN